MEHKSQQQRMLDDIAMAMYRTPYDKLDPISMEVVDFRYLEELEREFDYMMEQTKLIYDQYGTISK
jgi:hypothetical protein